MLTRYLHRSYDRGDGAAGSALYFARRLLDRSFVSVVMPLRRFVNARLRVVSVLLVALVLMLACSSGSKKGNTNGSAAGAANGAAQAIGPCAAAVGATSVSGGLLITRDQMLVVRDMKSGKETKLLNSPTGKFITYPAWSPDGKRFVYMVDSPFAGNATADWGADMCIADANGANPQLLLKHDQTGAEFESPSWSADGKSILFSYFLTQYDAQGQYKGQVYEARKLDLDSGTATAFLQDANGTNLCPNGGKVAYVDFDQTNFDAYGVWIADADGKNGKTLVNSSTGMQAFYAPTFSPDCKQVIFAAVGGSLSQPSGSNTKNPLANLIDLFKPGAAEAHGPPWDLWSVNVDGTGLTRLTHVNEDLPYPAWGADGKTVYFLGTGGLYQMQPDGGNLKKIDQGTVHGQISWRP